MVFAKENLFTEEQVAALFSIMKKTHTKAVETAFGNLEETLNYFKSLLQCHSVKRPPFCVQLFELHDVSKIMDYVTNTYFSHFKLYKYAFTPKVVLNLTIQYNNLENQDTQESVEEEITKIEENEKNEEVEVSDEIIEENSQRDENEDDVTAVNELKSIIKTAIDEEVAKLRVSINEKLKSNESQLASKINESNKSMLSTNKNEKKGKKR